MSGILTHPKENDPKAKTVGAAIFGDGCAAALLSQNTISENRDVHSDGPTIIASQVHQIRNTLDAVSLDPNGEDTYLHLARDLPELATSGLREIVDQFLNTNNLEHSQINHWIIHPGGRRIIENIQATLEQIGR